LRRTHRAKNQSPSVSESRIAIRVIGAGNVADAHTNCCAGDERVQLAATADTHAEPPQRAAGEFGARAADAAGTPARWAKTNRRRPSRAEEGIPGACGWRRR